MKKPETHEEKDDMILRMAALLIECRDALPAITKTNARLHNVDLNLDKKIEECLKPWEVD